MVMYLVSLFESFRQQIQHQTFLSSDHLGQGCTQPPVPIRLSATQRGDQSSGIASVARHTEQPSVLLVPVGTVLSTGLGLVFLFNEFSKLSPPFWF